MRRNNIALRRATHVAQKKQVELDDRTQGFLCYVNDALANAKERNLRLCHACQNELSCRFAVACDSCLDWYDRVCTGLRNEPRGNGWFCRNCYT